MPVSASDTRSRAHSDRQQFRPHRQLHSPPFRFSIITATNLTSPFFGSRLLPKAMLVVMSLGSSDFCLVFWALAGNLRSCSSGAVHPRSPPSVSHFHFLALFPMLCRLFPRPDIQPEMEISGYRTRDSSGSGSSVALEDRIGQSRNRWAQLEIDNENDCCFMAQWNERRSWTERGPIAKSLK